MQIVSTGDNLHKMSNLNCFLDTNKKNINLSPAELAHRGVMVNNLHAHATLAAHSCWDPDNFLFLKKKHSHISYFSTKIYTLGSLWSHNCETTVTKS